MLGLDLIEDGLLRAHERGHLAALAGIDRAVLDLGVEHVPAAAVLCQHEIDDAQMAAPEARHRGRHFHQMAGRQVGTLDAGEIGAGEDEVLVAGEHGIDAVDGGEIKAGVLGTVAGGALGDAGVREGYDDVRTRLLHLGQPGLGGLDDVARLDLSLEVGAVPDHDLRRGEADDADPDRLFGAVAVDELTLQDHVGLQVGFVGARPRAQAAPGEVGEDERKAAAGQRLVEEGQAVVELVIAQRGGLDAEPVHDADDRVDVALLHAPLIGHVVAHGVALKEIAIVEKKAVGRLGPRFFYQGGDLGEAHRVVLAVAVIVVGVDEHVDVRRLEQAEVDGRGTEDAARQAGGAE